jgi:hypothetical protein
MSKTLDPIGLYKLYVYLKPDICINDPFNVLGSPDTEIYKIYLIFEPVNSKTTKASLIIFDIYEYLIGPLCRTQSFLIDPELQNAMSAFK